MRYEPRYDVVAPVHSPAGRGPSNAAQDRATRAGTAQTYSSQSGNKPTELFAAGLSRLFTLVNPIRNLDNPTADGDTS
jgi:hypothetical protein